MSTLRLLIRAVRQDERGQSLPIVLALVTILFLLGSALAAHASTVLRTTAANEAQAGDLHGADAGAELGIWWERQAQAGNPPNIVVNGQTVTTTVTTSGGVACPSPTPVWLTGFEHGAVSASGGGLFTAVTGTGSAADSSMKRSGGYSLRIIDASGSANSVARTVSSPSLVARFAIRLASVPAANVSELVSFGASTGSRLALRYVAATQRLALRIGAGADVPASSTVTAGTWYVIDLRYTVNANPRTADWRIDGTAQTAASGAEVAAASVNQVWFGSGVSADAYTVNFDDVLVSGTSADYPIGDGQVLAVRPDGMGVSSGAASFTHEDGSAAGASTYLRLDDDPLTSTTDQVRQITNAGTAYLELTFGNTTANCLSGVAGVVAYHAGGSSANAGKTGIFDGATERVLFSGDMSETGLSYRGGVVAPAGASWTRAALNGAVARIGYSTDTTPQPYWDGLLLEYATGTSTPANVTVVATAGGSTVTTTYTSAGAAPPTLSSWNVSR
ncbi:MAG: hypothetical protein H0X16_11310 [Chloroflexi bacterium]|nr:hypothetical protein [Chloroflexota bacterium]